jgi:triphosphoribosyl-dephospho-CoA synthase
MMSVLSKVVRVSETVSGTAWSLPGDTIAARRLARLARQALIAEAELTPKPGLVDRRGDGAHTDLSLEIMRRSALAIEPYFVQMALASFGAQPSQSIRQRLALIGRGAERAMLDATGGSNSHKGAIWALGLLVSALAMHDDGGNGGKGNGQGNGAGNGHDNRSRKGGAAGARDITVSGVAATAKAIASFEDRAIPRLVSHGDEVAKRYGVAGARGEALLGFPHVVNVGLPALRKKRLSGASEQVARLDALLSIMSSLDDTCLLYRGGLVALIAAKEGAAAVAAAGGAGSAQGREELSRLDRRLLELRVSPGGSADLLAAALLLDTIERGQADVQADHSGPEGGF